MHIHALPTEAARTVAQDAGRTGPAARGPQRAGPPRLALALLPLLSLLLTACASTSTSTSRLEKAAVTPLNDLNLVNAPIPETLQQAARAPYALPGGSARPACETLAAEVRALDEVLGPDLDHPPAPGHPGLIERGGDAAVDAVHKAVQGAAEGVVPFRSWVRKLSGAERYSRQVAAAIAAGTVRRAFLKGLGQAQGCPR